MNPSKFQRVLHQRRSIEVSQTLHDVWPSPGLVHYVYTFSEACPLTEFCQMEFCQVQNSLCVQVLRSPILAALLHGTRAVGVSQTLRPGTRNGITELSQRMSPIFGRAAITCIGPQLSFFFVHRFFNAHESIFARLCHTTRQPMF